MNYDVVIVGAGASGLTAAYKLSKEAPYLKICVIEKEKIPGRKLKAAGNGKCNITNLNYNVECYHSESFDVFNQWFTTHSFTDVLKLFDELGIAYYEQGGYYYPLSNQGKQVVDVFEKRCKNSGVSFMYETTVCEVNQLHGEYMIDCCSEKKQETIKCQYLFMATGGFVSPKLGGSESGYHLLKNMDIRLTTILPGLSPIYVSDDISSVKGIRITGTVTVKNKSGEVARETGQIQFNENNISGIVIMNLSNIYNKWLLTNEAALLYIDLLPDYSWDGLKAFFDYHLANYPEETLLDCLNCILPVAMGKYILNRCKCDGNKMMKAANDKMLNKLTSNIKKMQLNCIYKNSCDKAQVTCGGVALEEIKIDSFETVKYKNLYILGELLDVNGNCGGYNISFAILSAIDAANEMIHKLERKND